MLFMRICVITYYYEVVGGLGHSSVHRKRCGLWESGCRRLARKCSVRRGSGAPSTDGLEHAGVSLGRMAY